MKVLPTMPRVAAGPGTSVSSRRPGSAHLRLGLVVAGGAWLALYALNERLWEPLLGDVLGVDLDSTLGSALAFFLYDSVKIMLLLAGLIFVIGLARASFSPERARSLLMGRGLLPALVLAAVLGAVTPFCSCSSVPVFIGLLAAGIPLAVTLTFLIASPVISEVGAVMMAGLFGWQVTVLYVTAGALMSIAAGMVISRFDLERWVEPFVMATPVGRLAAQGRAPTLAERVAAAREETVDIARGVWPYVLVGIGIGALIHGWVPDALFGSLAAGDDILPVVVATVAGIPFYVNPAGVVPLAEALTAKGVGLGTAMAFMMSLVALSVPSLVLLRRVMRPPLLATFVGIVTAGIVVTGVLLNLVT